MTETMNKHISLDALMKRYWPRKAVSLPPPPPSFASFVRTWLDDRDDAENGVIVHKGSADYIGIDEICDRYLVIDSSIWLEVDDGGNPISSRIADPYGRVHLEKACPTRRSRSR